MLHLPVYSDAERREQPRLPAGERTAGFAEVVAGLTEPQARYEAQRCLSCGNCFECDHCFAACPEDAIEKAGPGSTVPLRLRDAARGARSASRSCPVHAIEMVPGTGGGSLSVPEVPWTATPPSRHVAYRIERGVRDLSDHAVLHHGGAGRRVGGARS